MRTNVYSIFITNNASCVVLRIFMQLVFIRIKIWWNNKWSSFSVRGVLRWTGTLYKSSAVAEVVTQYSKILLTSHKAYMLSRSRPFPTFRAILVKFSLSGGGYLSFFTHSFSVISENNHHKLPKNSSLSYIHIFIADADSTWVYLQTFRHSMSFKVTTFSTISKAHVRLPIVA